ncbi:uncharacterized protein isoform X1 [Rhodnius prolixus]|uniref:uncharacterized protein isoform X1 n=2 Tax=Rhodnius prolixus TaxID=13249 RepID=UPI003D18AADA
MSASQLITAVYRRRPLWDPSDVHHHNRLLVANLWKDVGQELGLNVMLAKSKWRGLRDYYRQQVKRNMDQPEGQHGSGWAHFDQMSFLEPTIVPRQGKTPTSGRLCKEELTSSPETVLDISDALQQKWSPPPEWTTRDHDIYKYTDSEVSECEDEDLLFFRSLLPDLKGLSRPKKTYIRLKIQELIYKEIYGGCKTPTKKPCDEDVLEDPSDDQKNTYPDKEMKESDQENRNNELF